MERIGRPLKNEQAAAAAEYALLAGLIALAIVAGATALGLAVNAKLMDPSLLAALH
ncbi:MAG: Flp family type IVb pilin [Bacteroidetes bacterium]|nr:Flp family type IVb pilin [Bacteroidota bacterium]MCL5026980.1 Flp family type IVb pilin [Chloroflexota bacterium]